MKISTYAFVFLLLAITSCKEKTKSNIMASNYTTTKTKPLALKPLKPLVSKEFNNYWYAGEAELSSYKLEQVRYGEIRKGHSVLVYVTEPFLAKEQVKADHDNASNIPVLKLNSTKKFNTGIYPYSIMQSTFYPVSNNTHAVKVSASIQEWCGHTYLQLNNRAEFNIVAHSYFEGEADQSITLKKAVLENELWTQLRIDPKSLPVGNFEIIPSLEFIRLKHKRIKAYKATAKLNPDNYKVNIPELNRSLTINFNPNFPYDIISWEETTNGLTTKATKLKTIKSAYWNKNSNKDEHLRKILLLK